ncbi:MULTISPECIES: oligopeptide/dipeptide ABC transporter ATP-binding protein [unclassified Rhizobium]|uniref:oligopeptide/dipeptide ABC transporter ATP-binding protein n=1 Tax=unclassified Rhizobium TaxID=2613769 RepID=UPI0007142D63|nr:MULTISPECIES: oligopeptide/dipeptide ABC transporter ATP-binding protein [unclassified Rhizobium]KQS89440.1 peptide ABC transporter ATP-binding protein [Rhizobium sp. Leaf391]KQS94719.1 peptide ABC transporter ATP-binding protein [Rhizobium sp. Leaf386]KQU01097.1 peptide ABC transporter ATP-binding protein [Rhizobium sp. Leaf453]
MTALTLKDAVIRYDRLTAVDGVSLELRRGETLGLVGESGCGKSSVARAIVGLQPLAGGTLTIEGETLQDVSNQRRQALQRKIQLLFQDPAASLSPRMTVRSLLAEPLKIRGTYTPESRARIVDLAESIGLGEQLLSRYPHQLSGGQARRVALVRALAAEPSIIVADEPTAGLDISVQGELLNLLRALRDRLGLSYLLISHNLNVVGRVTDRVAVMYLGQIVESGPTAALFRAPAHPYTQALLSANLTLDVSRRRERIVLSGELPSPSNPPSGCRFHRRCPLAQPKCAVDVPTLQASGERSVACHFPLATAPVVTPQAIAG